MTFDPDVEVPGYADAVARESLIRDSSFLSVTETVRGFELVQMTVGHFIALKLTRSPLLTDGKASLSDLCAFLWLLNPRYRPRGLRRWLFLRRCRAQFCGDSFEHAQEAAEILSACVEYVNETFQDCGGSKSGPREKRFYSDAVCMIDLLASEYGWSDDMILGKSLKRVFQFCKRIKQRNSKSQVLFNPSDRILFDWVAVQEKAKANK